MAAQTGKAVLIRVDSDGMGTMVTIGGMRSKEIRLGKETVDVTDSDSANQMRELLAGAGVKSFTISGQGVFKDSAGEEDVRGYWFDDTMPDMEFTIPDFGTIAGPCDIPEISYAGEYNGEATFSMRFESAGAFTFTAA